MGGLTLSRSGKETGEPASWEEEGRRSTFRSGLRSKVLECSDAESEEGFESETLEIPSFKVFMVRRETAKTEGSKVELRSFPSSPKRSPWNPSHPYVRSLCLSHHHNDLSLLLIIGQARAFPSHRKGQQRSSHCEDDSGCHLSSQSAPSSRPPCLYIART